MGLTQSSEYPTNIYQAKKFLQKEFDNKNIIVHYTTLKDNKQIENIKFNLDNTHYEIEFDDINTIKYSKNITKNIILSSCCIYKNMNTIFKFFKDNVKYISLLLLHNEIIRNTQSNYRVISIMYSIDTHNNKKIKINILDLYNNYKYHQFEIDIYGLYSIKKNKYLIQDFYQINDFYKLITQDNKDDILYHYIDDFDYDKVINRYELLLNKLIINKLNGENL